MVEVMQIDFIDDLKTLAVSIEKKIRSEPRNAAIIAIAIVIAFATIAIVGSPGSDLGLRVETSSSSLAGVVVTNVGARPITIRSIMINNRKECAESMKLYANALGVPPLPRTIDVGDKTGVLSGCQVIRATIDTDRGSAEYNFEH